LQIDDQRIQIPQPLRFRAQVLRIVAIERVDADLARFLGLHADHVLGSTGKAMLGSEQGPDPGARRLENLLGRAKPPIDARCMSEQADAATRHPTHRIGIAIGNAIEPCANSSGQSLSPTASGCSAASPANR
jgi:hypothetical protein